MNFISMKGILIFIFGKIGQGLSLFILFILIVSMCGSFVLSPYIDGVRIIDSQLVFLEYRTTPREWQQGLSDRDGMCDLCGMLFIFPEAGARGFWMKDMRFSIDIIWLRDGEIIHIEHSVSHETPEKIYKPEVLANQVLELPAGRAKERGLVIGDRLDL